MASLTGRERGALGVIALLTAGAGAARYAGATPVLAFVIAGAALAGLAWIVSFGTEELGRRFGPGATGLMQSTLGNLPELFVVLFALGAGETVVAQTTILGSIFANALLVLGLVIIVGARAGECQTMRFGRRLPNDTATLLLVASFVVVVVGISIAEGGKVAHHIRDISIVAAVALLVLYGFWVFSYLRSEERPDAGGDREAARIPLAVSAGLLTAGGVGSAFVSDWFIHALQPAIHTLGISQAFAGLVIVAIAGNAVENATGLVLARKDKADLAISVVKNSVSQIIAFLLPVLVLASLLFSHQLTFAFRPVYIGALLVTAIAVWQVTGDGEAAAFEGWALVAIYVVLATVTLYE